MLTQESDAKVDIGTRLEEAIAGKQFYEAVNTIVREAAGPDGKDVLHFLAQRFVVDSGVEERRTTRRDIKRSSKVRLVFPPDLHMGATIQSMLDDTLALRRREKVAKSIMDTWMYGSSYLGDMTKIQLIDASRDLIGQAEGAAKAAMFYGDLAKVVDEGKRLRDCASDADIDRIKAKIWSDQ
jgi:hypothetical protein